MRKTRRTAITTTLPHIVTELNKEIEKIDKRIAELIDSDEELAQVFTIVTSIPGIGTQNAVCLMVYTDNFRRFNFDSRKIACYYGIAPFGRDSGTSVRICFCIQLIKLHPCPLIMLGNPVSNLT